MNAPLFSVVMVDYEGSIPRDEFRRAVQCFCDQTLQDFELLIYHDGPKETPYEDDLAGMDLPAETRFFVTSERENCWGHSNRDRGIRAARGKWIVHTNADNLFYPFALEEISKQAEAGVAYHRPSKTFDHPANIVVFPIILRHRVPTHKGHFDFRKDPEIVSHDLGTVLSGIPISHKNIDVMQFVMTREEWLAHGGWTMTERDADGKLYEQLAHRQPVKQVLRILGEHR